MIALVVSWFSYIIKACSVLSQSLGKRADKKGRLRGKMEQERILGAQKS